MKNNRYNAIVLVSNFFPNIIMLYRDVFLDTDTKYIHIIELCLKHFECVLLIVLHIVHWMFLTIPSHRFVELDHRLMTRAC